MAIVPRRSLSPRYSSGAVVPVVAARRPDVRFLVCRVCAALPHGEVILDTETGVRRRRGMTEGDVARFRELLGRMIRYALTRSAYDSLAARWADGAGQPWRETLPMRQLPATNAPFWDVYRGVLTVEPAEDYARLKIPVLVVLGAADDRILVDRHRPVFESLAARGANLTLWVIPDASHGLMLGPFNSRGYPAGLHDRLVQWVTRTAAAVPHQGTPVGRPD
jgi:hypothetical protein